MDNKTSRICFLILSGLLNLVPLSAYNSLLSVHDDDDDILVSDIPDQSGVQGTSFILNLDEYVNDTEYSDEEILWTFSGNSKLSVFIDPMTRIASISPVSTDWIGSETITFTATDPGGLSGSDPATFTLKPPNRPPVVSDIPNQTIDNGATFSQINLDSYVSDPDNADAEITWTTSGASQLVVTIKSRTRVATVTAPNAQWSGSETITFKATDPGGLFSSDAAIFTILPPNKPPVVSDIPDQTIDSGATFALITLDNYVSDPDNTNAQITWTISGASKLVVTLNSGTRVATVAAPNALWSGSETITFKATDPGGLFSSDAATFTVKPPNRPPVLSNIENIPLPYLEGSGQVVITNTIALSDQDNVNMVSATVSISSEYTSTEDNLLFINQNNINGSWSSATGILSLSGTSSLINYRNALRSIKYLNSNIINPSATPRTISFTVNDGKSNSNIVTRNITVTPVNSPPLLSNLETTVISYIEGSGQIPLTGNITLSDPDNEFLSSAIVSITENYKSAEDVLIFNNQNGITSIWNSISGVLTLSGIATIAQYQTAIRSIKYINNNNINPSELNRKVGFMISDGSQNSNIVSRSIKIIPVNNLPVASNVFISGSKTILSVLNGNYTYTDPEGDPEGTSEYSWYLADNSSGNSSAMIPGAISRQYKLQYPDGGKWIRFSVKPRDIHGGVAETSFHSPWEYINAAPVAQNPVIEGLIGIDQTVMASFNYYDFETNPEDQNSHIYNWYRANNQSGLSGKTLIGNSKYYSITSASDGKYLSFEVAPAALSGSLIGNTAQSDWYGPIGRLPRAIISGIDSVCSGDMARLTVRLTSGTPPWRFTYTRNGKNPITVSGINETSYTLNTLLDGKYVLTSVRDANRNGTVSGEGLVIFRIAPAATLSGGGAICEGTSATLRINLSGKAPWTIKYKKDNQSSISINNIQASSYSIPVKSAGNYSLTEVTDKYCVGNVSGSALVTNIPAPNVVISGLSQAYSFTSNAVPVFGKPTGGVFHGTGLLTRNDTVFFLPSWAGVAGSPHKILYTYQSPTSGCIGKDSVMVDILAIQADIIFPDNKTLFCYNQKPFIIRGINLENKTGSFSITGGAGLTDNGDNTATVDPSKLFGGDYEITFRYFHKTWFEWMEKITIEYINPIWFIGFNRNSFCNNEDNYPLNGNMEGGIFTGRNVFGNAQTGYYFQPSFAHSGQDTIFYTYTSANGCFRRTSELITVDQAPEISFTSDRVCLSKDTQQPVRFINNTSSTDDIVEWYWNFDDPVSGLENTSNLKNPDHFFNTVGTRYVLLRATTVKGCVTGKELRFSFGDFPVSDFIWDSECFEEGKDISFINSSTISAGVINEYQWEINTANSSDKFFNNNMSYLFNEPGDYTVSLLVKSNFGCADSITKIIPVRPTIKLSGRNYFEDFETGLNGWNSSTSSLNNMNSWSFGSSQNEFFGAASGINSWYTKISPGYKEQSYVISPCFDFTNSKKPMIKFDAWRHFDQLRDGVVMQYTTDNGINWFNLGELDDGINWYNKYAIRGLPGGQSLGWSNIKDKNWIEMRHNLDSLRRMQNVQFRLAYGSDGNNTENYGFAFDNFWIGEREKTVLLEHFTNVTDSLSNISNSMLHNILGSLNGDAINLQYHTSYPGDDPLNKDNPIVPEVRSFYYGLLSVPYTFLDGGITGSQQFDYTLKNPERKNVLLQSLLDPLFNLELNTMYLENSVNIDVMITARKVVSLRELTLHIAVIEKEISGIRGHNGDTVFKNVVRTLIPNPAGTYIYKSWNPGTDLRLNYNWIFDKVRDNDQIRIVAFVQDEGTKEVYQSAIDKSDYISSDHINHSVLTAFEYHCFPNPASDFTKLSFNEPLKNDYLLNLYSLEGKTMLKKILKAGIMEFEIKTLLFEQGLYIITITSNKETLKPLKFIVTR